MPIFDFRCTACGRVFEALVLGGRQPVCPGCGSAEVGKLPSRFGLGSGSGSGSSGGGKGSPGSSCGGCHASSCSGCR